jgi:crotonobetainyl-CoA:carnitine CoA-transferase CaiB-like acyl-CoA transferase
MPDSTLPRPLEGIRVIDLTVALAGPYGALLLGGLGAEVIHIESPGEGEIARTNPPFVGAGAVNHGAQAPGEVSLTTINRGRNKKSVTLNLKSARGRELFFKLVEQADVVLENMSEGTAQRLGVDHAAVAAVNPRIVYASISAFGDLYPGLKGMDIMVQAMSGLMAVTGFADGPPTRVGIPIADMVTPLFAVNGILAALIQRGRTGEGQHVTVSMLDCLASMVAEEHFDVFGAAGVPMRTGNSHDRLAPFGVYPCSDGHVAIVAFRPEWMKGLTEAMGRPELASDPRFASRGPRMKHAKTLNDIIEAWTRARSVAEVVGELSQRREVPVVPVRTPTQVLSDPALLARGAVMKLAHPKMGSAQAYGMGLPVRFSKAQAQFDQPMQELGAANAEIYGGLLGLSAAEIDALRADGIV